MQLRSTLLIFSLFLFAACSKSSDNAPVLTGDAGLSYANPSYNGQSYAISRVEDAASSSEGQGATSQVQLREVQKILKKKVSLASSDCSTFSFSACSNGSTIVNWSSCTETDSSGDVVTLSGDIAAAFSTTSNGAADNTTCTNVLDNSNSLPSGDTMNLVYSTTFIINSIPSLPAFDGMQVIEDSSPGTAWDNTTFPNASQGMSVAAASSSRTIVLNGTHDEVIAPHGTVWVNDVSTGQITVSGSLVDSNRTVQNGGTVTSWDNVNRYKVVTTFNNDPNGNPVTWTSSSCCHPTEGQLTSVYSGSIAGTTTLTFQSNPCGAATYVDVAGNSSSITLPCGQ